MGKLTARTVASKKSSGKYADGNGLYLQIGPTQNKSWMFRYAGQRMVSNTGKSYFKQVEMGLGSVDDISLAEAREIATTHHKTIAEGKDPRLKRDAERQNIHKNQIWTFDKCATSYIDAHSPSWKNRKHAKQWKSTLKRYASPIFGNLPVEDIDVPQILQAIEPIWQTKTETASRVRGRIERVLSWAIVMKYRPLPNPAIWRGNLDQLLGQPTKVTKPVHHAALPYTEIGIFMNSLNDYASINAQALRFTILTGCRTNEVLSAAWNEVDLEVKLWTIPAERMKSEREHRVPLSDQAIELLKHLPRENDWLFPSVQVGKHLSNMAMLNLLKKQMNRSDLTVHGFRSTFRDWVAEETPYSDRLAEAALAHVLGDKTEAAYQRGDMLKKRAKLMQAWADYTTKDQGNVIPIKSDHRKMN
jgi:integrase